MQASELASYIRARVPGDHVVVDTPEHPQLLFSPDVLVGGAGQLTAIFIVRQSTSMVQLRARLISARLALPAQSRIAAFLAADRTLPYDLQQAFSDIARPKQRKLLLPRADIGTVTPATRDDFLAIRRRNDLRSAMILQIVALRNRLDRKSRAVTTIARALVRRSANEWQSSSVASELVLHKKSQALAQVSQTLVVPIDSSRHSYRERLANIWRAGMVGSYQLDNGIPYPREVRPNIGLVGSQLVSRDDPGKPARAAAFAGWALVTASGADDVEQLAIRIEETYSKRSNELP